MLTFMPLYDLQKLRLKSPLPPKACVCQNFNAFKLYVGGQSHQLQSAETSSLHSVEQMFFLGDTPDIYKKECTAKEFSVILKLGCIWYLIIDREVAKRAPSSAAPL